MSHRRLLVLVTLALVCLTLVSYAGVLCNDFIKMDDPDYVTDNVRVHTGLTAENLRWAWTTFFAANWHPLTWMSLQLDAELFDLNPAGYHLTNLVWHTATVALLFGVLYRMTGTVGRSALVAGLFAVHPQHVESVAWVAERKDVLSGFFWVLTLGLYAWYAERPRLGRYLLAFAALALGLLAKPMLVTLPCVLLLLDYWPLRRMRFTGSGPVESEAAPSYSPASVGWLILEKVPLLALALASSVITFIAQREGTAVVPLQVIPLPDRLVNAVVSYAAYIGQTVWPFHLAIYYPHPYGMRPAWQLAAAVLVLAAVSVVAVREARRRPYLLVGWLWYLGTLVPVIGLVQVGGQARADRYTYLPHIGLFLAMVWGGADLLARWRASRVVVTSLAGAVLLGCAVLTVVQVGRWRNNATLWEHALRVTEANWEAHYHVAMIHAEEGRFSDAWRHLRAILEIRPDYVVPHFDAGVAMLHQRRLPEAELCLREVVRRAPRRAEAHFNLGMALLLQGRPEEAEQSFASAAALEPDNARAHAYLGLALLEQGKSDEAWPHLWKAVKLKPDYAKARDSLGLYYLRRGEAGEAARHFAEAVRLDPGMAEAHNHLGLARARQGAWREAATHFEQAVRLLPAAADYRANWAWALDHLGRKAEAHAEYRRLLEQDPGWPQQAAQAAWSLATNGARQRRNGPEAVRLAEQACQATGYRQPEYLDVLAAAHAEMGDFNQAVEVACKALHLASAEGQTELAKQIEERLWFYANGWPLPTNDD
ncbi:MAG TPA: tetratricopeptide repeat protein [Gemmataceae bacterium]|nr:tetratricopeptide repeat protein [Gemmataceae bacterium]